MGRRLTGKNISAILLSSFENVLFSKAASTSPKDIRIGIKIPILKIFQDVALLNYISKISILGI